MKKRDGGWIEIREAQPVFDRLLSIYGTKAKVAKAMGIHKQGFLNPNKKRIQVKTYMKARELLSLHERELWQHMRSGSTPLEVVSATKLSEVLRAWVVLYLKDHEDASNKSFMGPTKLISDRAGISERWVSAYINGTAGAEWVGVAIADRLLIAIDQHYLMMNGTVPVVPNPVMSMEVWFEYMSRRGCI